MKIKPYNKGSQQVSHSGVWALLPILFTLSPTVQAVDHNWNCTTAGLPFWDTSSCWDTGTEPTSADNVFISNGYEATIDSITGTAYANNITLDNNSTLSKTGSSTLNASNLFVGLNSNGTLNVSSNGVISNTWGYLGYNGGSSGTATVSGAGSQWNISNSLFVGEFGTGTLTVDSGGVVSNTTGYLGDNVGSSGIVTVSGAGSQWNSLSTLFVGNQGTGTLTVNSGGVVSTSHNAGLGIGLSGSGTAAISGAGSQWNISNSLYVGDIGTGILTVDSGGVVSDTNGFLGNSVSSSGTATVSGAGSQWNNSSSLTVGDGGTGSLTVDSGGVVSDSFGYLGVNASGSGTVTISGAGSQWNNSSYLYVGKSGTGTLTVDSGGVVSNTAGYLGDNGGSSGIATISGAGSQWNNLNALVVGASGTGTLTVDSGGVVSDTNGFLGLSTSGSGSATVSGAGSQWNNSSDFVVGANGTGTLTVDNGGIVSDTDGFLGDTADNSSTATISGAGSQWNNSGNLSVGRFGTGNLTVDNGGVVSNTLGYLGFNGVGSGTATVSGIGSQWNNTADLFVGGSSTAQGGTGEINVTNNGTLTVGSELKIWNTGTVNINGGSVMAGSVNNLGSLNFNAGTLHVTGDLALDAGLNSNLILNGAHKLIVDGSTMLDAASSLALNGGQFSTGSLLDNGGFSFNSGIFNLTNDQFVVGDSGLFGRSVLLGLNQSFNVTLDTLVDSNGLLLVDGGQFSAGSLINNGQLAMNSTFSELGGGPLTNHGLVSGSGRISATINNTGTGEIQADPLKTLRFTAAGNSNSGKIQLSNGNVRFDQDLTNLAGGTISGRGTLVVNGGLNNQGTIAFSGGFSDVYGNVNNNGTAKVIVSGNSTSTFYDDLVHNGSEIRVSAGSSAVFFGTVSGAGPYTGTGDLFFEGGLNFGNSPALVTVGGNITLGENNTTVMELGGLSRGNEYDAIDIGGSLNLNGILEVVLYDMGSGQFEPQLGHSFDLFTAESIIGDFDTLDLAGLASGLDWQFDLLTDFSGSTDIYRLSVVNAVPLPASAWMLGMGLLGLLGISRQRAQA